jgi:hypothetical protein
LTKIENIVKKINLRKDYGQKEGEDKKIRARGWKMFKGFINKKRKEGKIKNKGTRLLK